LSNPPYQAGFTLMELIVVMVIMGLLMAFAVPEFSHRILRDDAETAVNLMIQHIQHLKQQAVVQNRDLYMCFDTTANIIRIGEKTDEAPVSPEESSAFPETEVQLSDDIRIDHVSFAHETIETESDLCIRFYKKGYSDWAVIHLTNTEGQRFSLVIEPFLHKIHTHKGYVELDPVG
jgi:prepilin-type N-terminal cleavage/methylation domain-containing protein